MPQITPTRQTFITTAAIALVVALCVMGFAERDTASAADGETAQLISYFNSYRSSQGVGALTTSSSLNSGAQAAANQSVQSCSYQLPSGSGKKWGTAFYATASQVWAAYQSDPVALPWIADPKYHSVGIGRAFSDDCNFQYMWIFWLSTEGSGSTPAPTPTATPTVPPTTTAQPTATQQPTTTIQPTPTASAAPTETPEPTQTPFVQLHGDVNCDGVVNLLDAIDLMRLIGGADADAGCVGESGVDCTGGIDEADALALMRFLGGIPGAIPDGCPTIGEMASPTPEATPTETAGAPTESPTATPEPGSGATDHCWVAMIAYDMTNTWTLNGAHTCEPDDGAAYTCNFPEGSNQVLCTTEADGLSPYDCYVYPSLAVPCVATAGPGTSDYVCDRDGGIVCESSERPDYDCTVEGDLVTCVGPTTFTWSPAVS